MSGKIISVSESAPQARLASRDESARSAAVIVPLLTKLLPEMRSAVDVGSGDGAWIRQFQLAGISRVLRLTDAPVSPDLPEDNPRTIAAVFHHPFDVEETFDLAITLDLASRLPPEAASDLVTSLTKIADVVVFSGAIPGQFAEPELNERWPSYWISLFLAKEFAHFDVLRPLLWYDQRVNWHYAQNILVFVSKSREDLVAKLASLQIEAPLDIVHPRAFEHFRRGSLDPLGFFPYELVEEGYDGYNILHVGPETFLALAQSEGGYSPRKLAAGGYDDLYIAASAEEVKDKIPLRGFPPRPIEEGYRGYNLLQIGPRAFIALAQSEGSFSMRRLVEAGYKNFYVATSAEEVKAKIPSCEFASILIEENYRGYNILQIARNEFLALAQTEGPYSPQKLAEGAYEKYCVGISADEVKARIPGGAFAARLIQQNYYGYNILQIGPNEFLALAQTEGPYSEQKIAEGSYRYIWIAKSADEAKTLVRVSETEP